MGEQAQPLQMMTLMMLIMCLFQRSPPKPLYVALEVISRDLAHPPLHPPPQRFSDDVTIRSDDDGSQTQSNGGRRSPQSSHDLERNNICGSAPEI
jgi:hypothetical protein